MRILMIDTCGATGSVALADTSLECAVVASERLAGRTASEKLVGTIKDLSERSGISLRSLGAVAVVHGPGSFTGVRVGLSAAKGICEALGLPLIAISRLSVLARLADAPTSTRVYALLDAGRGEFYMGIYTDGVCLGESLVTRDQLQAEIDHVASEGAGGVVSLDRERPRFLVACEVSVVESVAELAPRLLAEPTAEDAFPLVLRRIWARDFDDPATLDASYLRRTDAEIFAKPRLGTAPEPQPEPPVR